MGTAVFYDKQYSSKMKSSNCNSPRDTRKASDDINMNSASNLKPTADLVQPGVCHGVFKQN